jgi:hypothetical protein
MSPRQPVFGNDFEEEDISNPYAEDNQLLPTSSRAPAAIRHLWDEDDPERLRYAIHDLSKKLRVKHRQFLDSPDRWARHVKGDLVLQGFKPDHVRAILSVVDSEAFGGELEGHTGLLVSVFRQIASEPNISEKQSASALRLRNDADVFGKVLVERINWFISKKADNPDFDPYDAIEQMLKRQNFESNVQIYCFFQRHLWLNECFAIPDYLTLDFRREKAVQRMKEVGDLLRELAQPFEEISGGLEVLSREMIGFDPPVTPLDTDEQVERLLNIYETYQKKKSPADADLTPIQALGNYFQIYGGGTESLVEQAAQLPELQNQPAPARSHADSGWQRQDDAVEDLAKVLTTLPQTPSSKR